jgi:hypothetical protein
LWLLARLLAHEAFIPEPTVASLRKYFPVLAAALPKGLPEDWEDRLKYYSDLVTQFGRSGAAPRSLRNVVKMWERHECGRAKDMSVPLTPWYQEAVAEWEQLRAAHRERHVRQPKDPPMPQQQPPPPVKSTGELAPLWAAPDPALAEMGLAVDPERLQARLSDLVYAKRYLECIGEPDEPDTPDATVQVEKVAHGAHCLLGTSKWLAKVQAILAADTAGVLQREPEYPPLPSWGRA